MRLATSVCVVVLLLLVASGGARADTITAYTTLSSFQADSGTLRVVGFDTDAAGSTIASGTLVDTEYSSWGVTFGKFNSGSLLAFGKSNNASSPNVLAGAQSTSHGGGGFEAQFSTGATEMGLWFCDLQDKTVYGATTLSLYGSSGSLIASYTMQDEIGTHPFGKAFFGVRSTAAIAKIQIAVGSNDAVWFDDLMFGDTATTPIPEPATLALFGLGGTGLIVHRRRKRRTA